MDMEVVKFIDPISKQKLVFSSTDNTLRHSRASFPIVNGIVDFSTCQEIAPLEFQENDSHKSTLEATSSAPELREAHDNAFDDAKESGGNIYGDLADLPLVTPSGHYRRMQLLEEMDLGDIADGVAVDFGTGPWGFGSIFPKLHRAKYCVGFDVSGSALSIACEATPSELRKKTIYATSDGECIPLQDNVVDIFFGGEVIEHVRSPFMFMQEISRFCKDGAIIILTTPNRDALYFKLFNQQYAVGPEHIALMDYLEFSAVLNSFSRAINVTGYETSLGASMDSQYISSDDLELVQKRSEKYPALATGMISKSINDKALYLINRQLLALNEYLWSSEHVNYSGQQQESLVLFDEVEGLLLKTSSIIEMPVSGQHASLLFWGHDWSGIVEISYGDVVVLKDLYTPAGGFIKVELRIEEFPVLLTVRSTGSKNEIAQSNQVIFYKMFEYIENKEVVF